jgi:hypothetical protein
LLEWPEFESADLYDSSLVLPFLKITAYEKASWRKTLQNCRLYLRLQLTVSLRTMFQWEDRYLAEKKQANIPG